MGLLIFRRMTRILLGTGTPLTLGTFAAAATLGPSTIASSILNVIHDANTRPVVSNVLPTPLLLQSEAFFVRMVNPIPAPGVVANINNPTFFASAFELTKFQSISPSVQLQITEL